MCRVFVFSNVVYSPDTLNCSKRSNLYTACCAVPINDFGTMSIYIAADYLTFSARSRYCLKSPSASYLTTFAKIIYKYFLRAVGIEPTIPSNPHLAALAYYIR